MKIKLLKILRFIAKRVYKVEDVYVIHKDTEDYIKITFRILQYWPREVLSFGKRSFTIPFDKIEAAKFTAVELTVIDICQYLRSKRDKKIKSEERKKLMKLLKL